MQPVADIKEYSKGNFTVENPTWDSLKVGALLRIADSLEIIAASSSKMASNYTALQNDIQWYRDRVKNLSAEVERLKHSRAGYMAANTKLRKRHAQVGVVTNVSNSNGENE